MSEALSDDGGPIPRQTRPWPIIWFDATISGLNAIGSAWIFVIMALINIDVFSRLLFNRPISGVPLIIEMSIIVIVFLQLAAALRRGRMTRSDVVIGRLLDNRPATGHLLQGVYHLAGFVLMILLIQYSLPLFSKAWRRGTYAGLEGDFTLPIWPIKLLIVVGAAVIMVQFLRLVRRDIQFFRYHSIHSTSEGRGVMYGLIAVAAVVISFLAMAMVIELSSVQIGLISIFFVLLLVFVGVHVGVALALLSFVCVWMIRGDMEIAGRLLALSAGESLRRYEFGVIPLFILMGLLVSVSDIGKDTYEVANHVFRRVKGGLGSATVAANAVFAAVTGTSIASASVFTKVAVPEMLRLGYKPRFAVGVVAGSSVLGMLIPPSLLLILFGILTETSIGDLFIAGILPGIVLSAAYCVLIWLMAHKFPNYVADASTLENALDSNLTSGEIVSKSVPILVLIFIIMGGIYGGLFTATEAGGVGVLGALVLTIAKRKLTWKRLWDALTETGYVTAAICFLLLSAHLYARMISISGIPNVMESMIMQSGMGLAGLITIYVVIIILLGTILDAGSIMLITVPLALVAVQPFGVDLIWLGIVTIIAVEIGLLTPPLGLAVFVIHNNLEDHRISVDDIFWGAAPFALTMLVVLILVLLIPDIALVLVR
ncbi:MAG: TRAP transporter large permease subunit [Rhodospirillales bacterium]|nr:TRAP transporter large permease subunit [Rhodospirillales bacterium]